MDITIRLEATTTRIVAIRATHVTGTYLPTHGACAHTSAAIIRARKIP